MAKQTKTQRIAELESQLAEVLSDNERLKNELHGERELRKIDLTALNNASIHNRYLNDEITAMEKSHANAIAVHRDAITLLLNHHRYKPRRLEWVDETGNKIDVSMNSTVQQSIQNHQTGVQSTLQAHDMQNVHKPGYGLPIERRSVLRMSED